MNVTAMEGIRARLIHVADDGTRRVLEPSAVDSLTEGWYWLDVWEPTADHADHLADRFALDRVTRDDFVEPQFPKFDDLDDYEVVVVHALAADDTTLRTVEVDVIIGERWIVTVHHEAVVSLDLIYERAQRPMFALDSPLHLACRIFEFVGERYLPLLDEIDAQVLDLEDDAVEGDPSVLPDIHALRRDIGYLRRVLAPQRRMLEVFRRHVEGTELAERDVSDALDHHVHLIESLDSAHQLVAGLLDTYRGAAAEQMNEIMKVLTVFSAIFLPLTLIAGVYGMNFRDMPELRQPWGYGATLAAMAVIAGGLWLYFIRRGFIGGPRLREMARAARVAGRVGRGLASAAALPIRVATRTGGNHRQE